jgi:hypothetical protein
MKKVYVLINKDGLYLKDTIKSDKSGEQECTDNINEAACSKRPFVSGIPWDAVACVCVKI